MQQLVHQAYTQYARGEEIVAMYCREALETTNAFSADTIEEDILDTIFSRFCIGK
jgi:tRNA U34 5-carboxymethylaminomethyl modifying GTPase MnmE/TrmE